MATNQQSTNGGIGFFGLLTIVFIVLKLTHVIDWSWWWVLAPSWMPLAIFIVIVVLSLIIAVIIDLIKHYKKHVRK